LRDRLTGQKEGDIFTPARNNEKAGLMSCFFVLDHRSSVQSGQGDKKEGASRVCKTASIKNQKRWLARAFGHVAPRNFPSGKTAAVADILHHVLQETGQSW
jgi:hypothetical protein